MYQSDETNTKLQMRVMVCLREKGGMGVGRGPKSIVYDNCEVFPVHYNIIKFNCLALLELL